MIWIRGHERNYIDQFTTAFLLNILSLVKISGLVLGLAIVLVGCIVRSRFLRSLVDIPLVLLLLGVMLAVDFLITGTNLSSVTRE